MAPVGYRDHQAREVPPGRRNRATASRDLMDSIRMQIYTGQLHAGERIKQDALAEAFGVSRLPVREALIALESEGLVRSEMHRGVYVIPIQREDIHDHYLIYGYIQGVAATRAATKLKSEEIEDLRRINAELSAATDPGVIRDLDWQFHSQINRAGGSRRLLYVLRQLGRALPPSLYAVPPTASALAVVEHDALLSAISDGDASYAGELASQHTLREGAYLNELLEGAGVLTRRDALID